MTAALTGSAEDADAAFALLFSRHPEPHCLIGVDGRIRAINDAAVALIGGDAEAVGMPFDSWLLAEDRALVQERLDGALAGAVQLFRMPPVLDAVKSLEREVTYVPLLDEHGAVHAVLCCTTDLLSASSRERDREEGAALLAIAGRLGRFGGWALPAGSTRLSLSPESRRMLELPESGTVPLEEAIRVHAAHERERVLASLAALFERAEPFRIEIDAVTAAGHPLTLSVLGEPVIDDRGVVVSARGALWDVTEAAEARARSSALERRLDDTLNAFGDGLAFLDAEARISYVNQRAASMMGMPPDRLIGMSLWELFPEARGSRVEAAFHRAIEAGERTQARERSDRLGIWLDCTLHPTRGGLVLYARDATEDERMRRAAEAAQRRVAEQAALLDASRDAVIVRSLDGIVQYCNAAAAQLYGWDPADAVGRSIHELVEDRSAEFDAAMEATLTTGYWADELHESTRDGRSIIVDSRWQLLQDDAGAPTGVLSLGTDVTRWRQDEQERIRARRLESLGTLAGGIAHDLNNVLTPILMAVQLLGQGEQEDARRELLATMETAARRGADMVAQVLAFARGVDGRRERIRLAPLLAELGASARELLPDSVALEIAAVEPDLAVLGDSTQLLQVLTNLVTNARDAMPGGGTLSVRAHVQHDRDAPADAGPFDHVGARIAIDVDDEGSGMPEEVVEKIFEPFFTTKPLGRGTGLGLATSLSIVRSHGGSMRVSSEPGRGTRVRIVLPLAEEATGEAPPAEPVDETAPLGRGELVLVVDDDASIRLAAVQTLRAHGYRALAAADGREAIALVENGDEAIDIVLTDMMMPVMDGAATTAYLEEHHPALPVVASSGLISRSGGEQVPGMGVAAFLPKPYSTASLLTVLRAALDGARRAGAAAERPAEVGGAPSISPAAQTGAS
ncbi:hybrid sensor histidine kinase/response regulator [Microcella flavibacter]|uniref:hybrid sensor histidine kinase/response regulator n=1 Tax=Microcella flavibacter TaxID=1804990 RepID=UPI0014566D55|nr:PAS domain-containing protein [Microcella flavibacter]